MINWREYIESDPKVMYGKPVITGTRIPIDLILEKLSDGESTDELLDAYPRLSKEGIAAVLAYATDAVRNDHISKKYWKNSGKKSKTVSL